MADGCAFCRVVAGELPSSIVLESDALMAFMDIDPVTPGHMLVVPERINADVGTFCPNIAG